MAKCIRCGGVIIVPTTAEERLAVPFANYYCTACRVIKKQERLEAAERGEITLDVFENEPEGRE